MAEVIFGGLALPPGLEERMRRRAALDGGSGSGSGSESSGAGGGGGLGPARLTPELVSCLRCESYLCYAA